MKGIVFNIQRFSTHDGPGVRTTVFLKGCPLRCFWCQNPESQSIKPTLMIQRSSCTDCGRCIGRCPVGASYRQTDGTVQVQRSLCTACGRCANGCLNDARSIAGQEMEAAEVMDAVRRDRAMYNNSGGGMTLSGGEVTAQPDFAIQLLKMAQAESIHTAIETCGYAKWSVLERILEHTDYVMYDIKSIFPERHKDGTGVDNTLILENAKKVAGLRPCLFRMPLIPGFNDAPEDVRALAQYVKDELGLTENHIELLPYNNLGEEKYLRMGKDGTAPKMQRQSDEYLALVQNEIRKVFSNG